MTEARVALITGANRGIGFEILKSFAAVGYTIIGTSRSKEGKAIIDNELGSSDSRGFGSILDVKDKDAIKHFPAEGEGTLSGIIVETDLETGLAQKVTRLIDGGSLTK